MPCMRHIWEATLGKAAGAILSKEWVVDGKSPLGISDHIRGGFWRRDLGLLLRSEVKRGAEHNDVLWSLKGRSKFNSNHCLLRC